MEKVLPQEIVIELLKFLPERDLFMYGCCSKVCNASAEQTWKMKLADLLGGPKKLLEHLVIPNPGYECYKLIEFKRGQQVFSHMSRKENKEKYRSWFSLYYKQKVQFVTYEIKLTCENINVANPSDNGFKSVLSVFDYVRTNLSILQTRRYTNTMEVIERKLIQFLGENRTFEKLALHYLEEMFPETYYKLYVFELDKFFCENQ
jgi:hypothetical protein